MPLESMMLSNHLNLCSPLHLLPSTFPSIRVFSNELTHRIRWPKFWSLSFSFSISPFREYSGLISFRIDWFDLLAVQGTLSGLLHNLKVSILWSSAFMVHLSLWSLALYTAGSPHQFGPKFPISMLLEVSLCSFQQKFGSWHKISTISSPFYQDASLSFYD